jgi:hypothetical protein
LGDFEILGKIGFLKWGKGFHFSPVILNFF